MQKYEYKKCNLGLELQTKAVDTNQREVTFYAAAFGSLDDKGDIIQRGAFAKTIRENELRFKWLNQHDPHQLVGPILTIQEDDFGLLVTARASETQLGNDVLALEVDRAYEHSIGFYVVKDEYDSATGIRIIKEVQLREVSSVTWGSNPNTPTIGIKSLSREEQGDYLLKKLSRLDETLGKKKLSDERVEMLRLEVLQIKKAVQDSFEKSLPESQPEEKTTEITQEPTRISNEELLDVFRKALTL